MTKDKVVFLDGNSLTKEDIYNIVFLDYKVDIEEKAYQRVLKSFNRVKELVDNEKVVYGLNTGFGALANTIISKDKLQKLQLNLLRSHACGVGDICPKEIPLIMLILRLNSLIKGFSGVSIDLVNQLKTFINKRIIPVVYCQGSVGASGDLVPLAHAALPLIGEGEVFYNGKRYLSKEVLDKLGIKPIKLQPKEGLALINGTQFISAYALLSLIKAEILIKSADIISALTLEATLSTDKFLDERIHKIRPHKGQLTTAKNIKKIVEDSQLIKSHRKCNKVQDPYSIRCIPQIHGAVKDAYNYVLDKIHIEINSVTDNPLIFDNLDVITGGNFHGEVIAIPLDYLKVAISNLGNVSERRSFRLLSSHLSQLPPFLIKKDQGLNSGFMIAQYTAASLVSENKVLSFPASVDSIPTSASQEDYVSMGAISARYLNKVIDNVFNILSIELITSLQALDFRNEFRFGKATQLVYDALRKEVKSLTEDKILYEDIKKVNKFLKAGNLIKIIEDSNIILEV